MTLHTLKRPNMIRYCDYHQIQSHTTSSLLYKLRACPLASPMVGFSCSTLGTCWVSLLGPCFATRHWMFLLQVHEISLKYHFQCIDDLLMFSNSSFPCTTGNVYPPELVHKKTTVPLHYHTFLCGLFLWW